MKMASALVQIRRDVESEIVETDLRTDLETVVDTAATEIMTTEVAVTKTAITAGGEFPILAAVVNRRRKDGNVRSCTLLKYDKCTSLRCIEVNTNTSAAQTYVEAAHVGSTHHV